MLIYTRQSPTGEERGNVSLNINIEMLQNVVRHGRRHFNWVAINSDTYLHQMDGRYKPLPDRLRVSLQ